ncbi:uncharacterized protein LOC132162157 isoform X2 [Corylus avellana]|nr:uncharacterized protein LOC132162157 isoform X2 [Corylus avellana]
MHRLETDTDRQEVSCLRLDISTNVSLDGVDASSIISKATSTVANLIGKPEDVVMIGSKGSIPRSMISFGSFDGNEEASAFAELVSNLGINLNTKDKLSSAIASIFGSNLSISKTRFFVKFYDEGSTSGTANHENTAIVSMVMADF